MPRDTAKAGPVLGKQDADAEDAHLLHLPDELLRIGVGVLKFPRHGPHLTVGELAHQGGRRRWLRV